MRLLLVEDDAMIGESVAQGLERESFAVDWVRDGAAAELALAASPYALVLLDLGLPRKSGLALLRDLRKHGARVPVLVVTARDAVHERVEGLDAGADDYVVKPFALDELTARIRALVRRSAGSADPVLTRGALRLDPLTHVASFGGTSAVLSGREFALLWALAETRDAALSRNQLEDRLYGWKDEIESNAIEVHIHNVRRKLGSDVIRNLRGVGYLVSERP